MSQASALPAASQRIKQERGRRTYEALVATGFKLLEEREFESITIAELAREAGYSVGAFYARFKSKDEYFDALIAHHLEQRTRERSKLFATLPDGEWINALIADAVNYYWKRRRFWRAALIRSINDPQFWQPIREHGHELASAFIERMEREARRRLTSDEEMNVRFAMQIALGTINNTIINRPGPIFMGQKLFVENLARAFRLVSGYDAIVGSKPKRRSGRARG
ncbi:MAG: TetR/AcrR family transcriptional regulator [Gammaproteobacteria bacterium]|nr:TetR/AcrR family transcriptional regulator [Gammaproteobacteria bacterium]